MKTLDEVIKALECCCEIGLCKTECPYQDDCMDDKEKRDALYYLKEYREKQEMLRYWSEKAISEQQNLADAYMLYKITLEKEKDNLPLTWDELRTMEGLPVWVECKFYSHQWAIIGEVTENRIRFYGPRLVDGEPQEEIGVTWQAYRKERG